MRPPGSATYVHAIPAFRLSECAGHETKRA